MAQKDIKSRINNQFRDFLAKEAFDNRENIESTDSHDRRGYDYDRIKKYLEDLFPLWLKPHKTIAFPPHYHSNHRH